MSAAPDKSSGKHPSPAKPHTQLPMQVSVALLLGAAALLLAAVNWYSARREDETRDAQLATLTQNFTGLEQAAAQKSALDAESAAVQQSLKAETDRLDSLDSALTEMRKHSEEGRDAWIKAEAASLLVAANEEIEDPRRPRSRPQGLAASRRTSEAPAGPTAHRRAPGDRPGDQRTAGCAPGGYRRHGGGTH